MNYTINLNIYNKLLIYAIQVKINENSIRVYNNIKR